MSRFSKLNPFRPPETGQEGERPSPQDKGENIRRQLKEDLAAVKARLREVEDQWHLEQKKTRKFIRQTTGVDANPRINASDQLLQHCDRILSEKSSISQQLKNEQFKCQAEYQRAERLESDLRLRTKELLDAEKSLNEYGKEFEELIAGTTFPISVAEDAKKKAEKEVKELRKVHMIEIANFREAHRLEKEAMEQQHQTDIIEHNNIRNKAETHLRSESDETIRKVRDEHDEDILQIVDEHEKNTRRLNVYVKELEADLLSQTDDFRPATDQALKIRFGELKKLVRNVTLPYNLQLPATAQLSRQYDRTGFLARHGQRALQWLLPSLFWEVLIQSFFSTPFGFGSLGTGPGRDALLAVQDAWSRLYEGRQISSAVTYSNNDEAALAIFSQDHHANKFRSAVFQSLLTLLSSKGDKSRFPTEPNMIRYYTENCRAAEERLLNILNEVTSFQLRDVIKEKIPKIASMAGELALELGVQRAKLCLTVAQRQDSVRIGPEFHDCVDGDQARGQDLTVDLLVAPGLLKVGDGRGDLKLRRILVPGDIYSVSIDDGRR